MKKVIFSGGLGNQMFQYAFYLFLKKKGIKAVIDNSLYSEFKMHNGFELIKVFDIKESIYRTYFLKVHLIFIKLLMKIPPVRKLSCKDDVIPIGDHEFDPPYARFYLGYWQSKKIVNYVIEELRAQFIFRNIPQMTIEKGDFLSSINSVSIHIRRGDYMGIPAYQGIRNEIYYERAISFMKEHFLNPRFYVFSNDSIWAKLFLEKFDIDMEIIVTPPIYSYWDMYLMSRCRNHIIANSTFSWWAAVLNMNKDKIVISPTIFKKDECIDIIFDDWVKISNI